MGAQKQVDGKPRTDATYPAGFMGTLPALPLALQRHIVAVKLTNRPFTYADVISIDRTDEHFRLLYNVKGRFAVHRIKSQEAEVRPISFVATLAK